MIPMTAMTKMIVTLACLSYRLHRFRAMRVSVWLACVCDSLFHLLHLRRALCVVQMQLLNIHRAEKRTIYVLLLGYVLHSFLRSNCSVYRVRLFFLSPLVWRLGYRGIAVALCRGNDFRLTNATCIIHIIRVRRTCTLFIRFLWWLMHATNKIVLFQRFHSVVRYYLVS